MGIAPPDSKENLLRHNGTGYVLAVPSFAETVLAARNARELTQTQFAAAVGVSMSTIYEAERGSTPSEDTVSKIATFLGVTPEELVGKGTVFRRGAPRKRTPVRSTSQERYSGSPVPTQGGGPPVADPDLFEKLRGYWSSMGSDERAELLDIAYRLCAPKPAPGRHKAASGKTKG
jgi:transcriptional regulator with XRE-family HTH domain